MQMENKILLLELCSVLNSGTHRGKTVKQVIDFHIGYFVEMIKKHDEDKLKGRELFTISGEAMNYYREIVNTERESNYGFRTRGAQRRF
jgi:hypothetical protein